MSLKIRNEVKKIQEQMKTNKLDEADYALTIFELLNYHKELLQVVNRLEKDNLDLSMRKESLEADVIEANEKFDKFQNLEDKYLLLEKERLSTIEFFKYMKNLVFEFIKLKKELEEDKLNIIRNHVRFIDNNQIVIINTFELFRTMKNTFNIDVYSSALNKKDSYETLNGVISGIKIDLQDIE